MLASRAARTGRRVERPAAGQVVLLAAAEAYQVPLPRRRGRHRAASRRPPGSCRTAAARGAAGAGGAGGPRPLDWCWAAGAEETRTWAERDMPVGERRCRALPFAWPKSGRLRIAPGLIHLGAGRAEYTTCLDLCLWLAWMNCDAAEAEWAGLRALLPHAVTEGGPTAARWQCLVRRMLIVVGAKLLFQVDMPEGGGGLLMRLFLFTLRGQVEMGCVCVGRRVRSDVAGRG